MFHMRRESAKGCCLKPCPESIPTKIAILRAASHPGRRGPPHSESPGGGRGMSRSLLASAAPTLIYAVYGTVRAVRFRVGQSALSVRRLPAILPASERSFVFRAALVGAAITLGCCAVPIVHFIIGPPSPLIGGYMAGARIACTQDRHSHRSAHGGVPPAPRGRSGHGDSLVRGVVGELRTGGGWNGSAVGIRGRHCGRCARWGERPSFGHWLTIS